MLRPAGDDRSLFPGSTCIISVHGTTCLISKLASISCQLQHTFNQTKNHHFNSKNYLEGAAELLGAVLWWCNFMMQ